MTLEQLIIGWFFYGIFFMGLSVLATYLINRVAKHYYTAPLIINAVAIIILMGMVALKQFTADMFLQNYLFTYMPIVAASVTYNLVLFLIRRGRPLHNTREEALDTDK